MSFIVHSLGEVNESLERGEYFFVDIIKDGIALYEKPGHPFRMPKPLAPADRFPISRSARDRIFR